VSLISTVACGAKNSPDIHTDKVKKQANHTGTWTFTHRQGVENRNTSHKHNNPGRTKGIHNAYTVLPLSVTIHTGEGPARQLSRMRNYSLATPETQTRYTKVHLAGKVA